MLFYLWSLYSPCLQEAIWQTLHFCETKIAVGGWTSYKPDNTEKSQIVLGIGVCTREFSHISNYGLCCSILVNPMTFIRKENWLTFSPQCLSRWSCWAEYCSLLTYSLWIHITTLSPTQNYMQFFLQIALLSKQVLAQETLKLFCFIAWRTSILEINSSKSKLQTLRGISTAVKLALKKKSAYPRWNKMPTNLVLLIVMHKSKEELM